MAVGSQFCHFKVWIGKRAIFFDDVEFFFLAEIIADVFVKNTRFPCPDRIFNEQGYGYRGPAAGTEDIAFLFLPLFTGSPGVSSQIKDIDRRKLLFEAFSESGCRVAVKPATV